MLIDSFLAFLPRPGEARGETAADFVLLLKDGGYQVLESGYTLGFRPRAEPRDFPSRFLVRANPGTIRSRIATEVDSLTPDEAAWEAWARRRVRLYNLFRLEEQALEMWSDVLGVMRYYRAELGDGLLLSSSIRSLLTAFPELQAPADPMALLEVLTGGSPRDDRTVHQRVRMGLPGEVVSWTAASGPRITRTRRLQAPEIDGGISSSQAIETIVSQMGDSIEACVADRSRVLLPLTGGFDSRLIACIARSRNLAPSAITIGRGHHLEVRLAKALVRMLDLEHRVVTPRPDILDFMESWLQVTEGQSGVTSAFICELLHRGYPSGTTILHGFLNDALVVGSLNRLRSRPLPDRAAVAEIMVEERFRGLRPGFQDVLGLPFSRSDRVEAELAELPPVPEVDRAYHLWHLENRQRRGIAAMLLYLGREYHAGAPAYDPDLIRTWMSMPRIALENKHLLRQVFLQRWPKIAILPPAEEPPSRIPRGWQSGRYAAAWGVQRIRHILRRRLTPGGRRKLNPTNIWPLWFNSTPAQRDRELRGIAEKGGAIHAVLGWELPGSTDAPIWKQIAVDEFTADQVLRSCYLLAEYCHWIRQSTLAGGGIR